MLGNKLSLLYFNTAKRRCGRMFSYLGSTKRLFMNILDMHENIISNILRQNYNWNQIDSRYHKFIFNKVHRV